MQNNNLLDRTFKFGVNCIIFLRTLPRDFEYNVIKLQLTKSSTSIGANYEESQAGSSKADFKNKVRISLRKARESNYWWSVINALERSENEQLESLIQESKGLKNILASIINNTKL